VKLRVVAGTAEGVTGPVTEIAAAPLYLDAHLEPGAEFVQPLPAEHTALAYVFEGAAVFGDQNVAAVQMLKFGPGDNVRVRTQAAAFVSCSSQAAPSVSQSRRTARL